ncbi:type II toxin-antitoxin system RelE/ParE family toxin [Lelliottia amnigena]|uniref:type II toxin-antitoxin system RelE family toxin n=1 Tax=Lelliottia amnigena TaxID=61646 RepID=UPI001F26BC84|nr:type II toxin-antitoxin system RelE/ParE family toxin [Lelliottia amnigena]UJD93861.1 type II toxin-antitoxin system RelE/ParE family toxin [Lelliottia amnigena]
MKIIWSRSAKRDLAKIEVRAQKRIEEKVNSITDKNTPRPDIKKLSLPGNYYRLRAGEYRVIFMIQGESRDVCYIVAVKRRSSTAYLHEESVPYGCTTDR